MLLALFVIGNTLSGLHPNPFGQPQELKSTTQVCQGRSEVCSVLLDVPVACASGNVKEDAPCPYVYMCPICVYFVFLCVLSYAFRIQ